MIENDNENKLAKKTNGPVVKNAFRFIEKNLRFKYRTMKHIFFTRTLILWRSLKSPRKLNESSVARKAYKNLTSAIDIIYNPSCPLSPLSSSSKKRSGETDAFKQWPLLERSEFFSVFFCIILKYYLKKSGHRLCGGNITILFTRVNTVHAKFASHVNIKQQCSSVIFSAVLVDSCFIQN